MRRSLIAMILVLGLVAAGPAVAAYEGGSGGTATPSSIGVEGAADYSVSLTGKAAAVDLVLVLDNSGSMSDTFGSGSKWNALTAASEHFVEELSTEGFFTRGGKVGVVLFSAGATAAAAPTSDVSTIDAAIASGSPQTESCISCGLKLASEMLSGISNSAGHKRIAYVMADGENTVTPPTVTEAVTAAEAAGVERRVIGIGSGASGKGLENLASSGTVVYPTNIQQLEAAYAAQTTHYPGATNVSWSFHLTPGFTASAATASVGSATAAGGEVTWTIPSLGEATTATLTFHASHSAAAGCAATSLLSSTTFSDAEGDAAPAVGLGTISISGCAAAGGGAVAGASGPRTSSSPPALKPASVIVLPKPPSGCSKSRSIRIKLKPPAGTSIKKALVSVTGQKAKTYAGAKAKSPIVITKLPAGHYKVKVTVKLSDGRSTTLAQSYVGCPAT